VKLYPVTIKTKKASMLKIPRNIADIIENTALDKFAGNVIFVMISSILPPSRLLTGNKFIAAYIIWLSIAKNKTES